MKKLLIILASISLISLTAANAVSCTFRKYVNGYNGVLDVPDYDWTKTNESNLSLRELKKDELPISNTINSTPDNIGKSLNWNNIKTGYRTYDQIQQQTATGVPLENNYNLTGNVESDFGFTGIGSSYKTINDILSWSPENNADAKYSEATVKLQKRESVGEKWTSTQNKNIQFISMGRQYAGRFNGVDGNGTITGQQNIFQQNFSDWQYADIYVWWRGTVGVPSGEFTDYAHINGAKSYGILYLDGFFGLKPGMITDLLKKDSSGNYLIVNKMIEMAKYYGFDGWFVNEEANGAFDQEQPVLKYEDMVDILNQFTEQAKKEYEKTGDDIGIISYTNSGTLEYNNSSTPINNKSVLYARNSDGYLTDFGDNAYSNEKYSEANGTKAEYDDKESLTYSGDTKTNFNVYNQWDFGSERDGYGKFECAPSKNVYWDKLALNEENEAINSIGVFGIQASWEDATDYFTAYASDSIEQKIQRIQKEIQDETTLFSGTDMTSRNSWYESEIGKINENNRSEYSNKSFGISNLVQEKTLIINGIDNFETSFSIGEGKKWVDSSSKTSNLTMGNGYTWFNRSLGDVQPTYKWDVFKINSNNSFEEIKHNDDLGGYYDFDEVYNKGNSLALGSSYYNDKSDERVGGSILPTSFSKNTTYGWDIMGANLTDDNNYDLNIVFKVSTANEGDDKKINPDIQNDLTNDIQLKNVKLLLNDNVVENTVANVSSPDENGWSIMTLKNIKPSEFGGVYKIGVAIANLANDSNFKLNVGQIKINLSKNLTSKKEISNVEIKNFDSEYTIVREKSKTINIRMSWKDTSINPDDLKYYEIYYKLNNKIYRYGETRNSNYWMGDIKIDNLDNQKNFEIYIRPVYNNSSNNSWTKINLNIEGWEKNE